MKVPEPYRFESMLNQSAFASTVLARDLNGQAVVIKILMLKDSHSWKAFDLLQREAQVLQSLDHPAIPRLLDFGSISDPDTGFYLVTEYIEAPSLQYKIAQHWRCDLLTLRQIALQILEVLDYLHHLLPSVIHRDLKPANLLLDANQKIHLIDFGGVQAQLSAETERGSTIIGTYGYMAPEQFGGRAVPQSDLYALGASLVHLASGVAPAKMSQAGLRLVFEPHLTLPAHEMRWLKHLLDPDPMQRFQTARQASQALVHMHDQWVPVMRAEDVEAEGLEIVYTESQLLATLQGNVWISDCQIRLTPQSLQIQRQRKKGLKTIFELDFAKVNDLFVWHQAAVNYRSGRNLVISYRFHIMGLPFQYTRQKKILVGAQKGLDRLITEVNQTLKAYLASREQTNEQTRTIED